MAGILRGLGVSPGVAVGPAVIVSDQAPTLPNEPAPSDVAAELARVDAALEAVAGGFDARAAVAPLSARPILEASAMMARDPGLRTSIEAKLAAGIGAAHSVTAAFDEFAAMLLGLGGYMAERATDLADVRDRTASRLLGLPEPGLPQLTEPSIVVARDLAPAETVGLNPKTCLAIVTEAGGPTSHTAILANQLGIPAVVRVPGAIALAPATILAVDGSTGEVVADPDAETVAALDDRRRRRTAALGAVGPGATADQRPVPLLANIGTPEDAARAGVQPVGGSGLFRTEFLFLDRETAPTLEEQAGIYRQVFEAFGQRRVVVRTLDAGADKPLRFADLGPEENPALGRRGLRLAMERPDLLDTQLRALNLAREATGADVWVMAPMVSTAAEAAWFADRARSAGLPKAGVMIEVPSAAIRARQILAEVDFASLGTNDLSQYTFAADRMQGGLATLLSPWQGALLDLVASAAEAGSQLGKSVGVCGEAAGDPLAALALVGLGVTSLSMALGKVPGVRTALSLHTFQQCRELAQAARSADSAETARAAALALADPLLADIL
ncbi:MAG: phosphoenolpyruvate--protein phosphotransferase [Propionibacteriaceae bacterium]|nr:phosphoenolpyruvate--protein phosphotransferase [Propionibacteriaceae bacterium]